MQQCNSLKEMEFFLPFRRRKRRVELSLPHLPKKNPDLASTSTHLSPFLLFFFLRQKSVSVNRPTTLEGVQLTPTCLSPSTISPQVFELSLFLFCTACFVVVVGTVKIASFSFSHTQKVENNVLLLFFGGGTSFR